MENYESFDHYFNAQTNSKRKIISRLRELVLRLSPDLTETVKWGNGSWVNGKLPVMFVHCKEDYVQFGFYGGTLLKDPESLLKGNGNFVKHVPITSEDEVEEARLEPLILQASTLNYKA